MTNHITRRGTIWFPGFRADIMELFEIMGPRPSLVIHAALFCIVAWTASGGGAMAIPYLPADDRQVLERLPSKPLDAAGRDLRKLRAQLTGNPRDEDAAAALARRYITLAREDGDPRHLGHAQAVLAPWWEDHEASPPLLVLRATVKQSLHDFNGALRDLDLATARHPQQAQAQLTRAAVLRVQGRYEEARQSCRTLFRSASSLLATACLCDLGSLTGQARPSYVLLKRVMADAPSTREEHRWGLVTLAEIAARSGQYEAADAHFQEAIRLGVNDQYLLGAYADLLLDQGRAKDVRRLLDGETRSDGLLLRAALAEQALHSPKARELTALLDARFAASRRRGDQLHRREEARFTLTVLGRPHIALQLAQANWAVQREPWDARILLESALAARDAPAAIPVLDWMRSTKIEDVHLQALAERIGALRP